MNEAIEKINAEQAEFVGDPGEERNSGEGGVPPGSSGPGDDDGRIIPIHGLVTSTRYSGFVGEEPISVAPEEGRRLAAIMRDCGLIGSPLEFKVALARHEIEKSQPPPQPVPEATFSLGDVAPSEEENILRKNINDICNAIDKYSFGMRWGSTNGVVKKEFAKSREEMELAELRQVWAFLNRRFPQREVI